MTDLKELKQFFKICRSNGVLEIELNAIKVKFGDMPTESTESIESEALETPELSPDELIYYSATQGINQ
jgi:hypothetical protein